MSSRQSGRRDHGGENRDQHGRRHRHGHRRRPSAGGRRRLDLYGEVAGVRGRVLLRLHGEALETARLLHLVLHLEVGVEGVGGVAGGVHAVARRAVAQRGAVGVRAGVVDVVADPAHGVRRGARVEHAPRAREVGDAARRHERRVPALPCEVHGVLGLAVVPEDAPVALEVARRHALGVLVDEAEQVHLHVLVRPQRRPGVGRQLPEQPGVEPLREVRPGVLVAVGWPPDLADDDGEAPDAGGDQRRHERVEVGVEHVGVLDAVGVDDGAGRAVEEGVVEREVVVAVQAQEGVDVDGEGRAALVQELHDLRHQPGDVRPEPPRRRHLHVLRRVVHVGVQRHGGLDGVAVAGVVEGSLDVLQSREGHVQERAIQRRQEWLVPDGNISAGQISSRNRYYPTATRRNLNNFPN
ncbi:Os03g0656850 [Oryza sativa Japonica Group]|uniref:Os03g0656850 protein n=1 Tax=Oryza sativa subsp. japonica TaxID=39947 RepID=A0A0P0W0W2_ORYSJ|nr:hypothetical protein EE612_019384 [Oryza sativa]BAS85565.1 Os03g0656850 [Oryza sativa Japonica Group]